MRHRLDPLIAERAPWISSDRPGTRLARHCLEHILGYPETLKLGAQLAPCSAKEIMSHMAETIAKDVSIEGLRHIPRSGPAIIVANHPTGIADGIVLWHAISEVREDAFFFANSDILRVLPQLDQIIAPVEWRKTERSRDKTRTTLNFARQAMDAGRLGVLFPSGRLAKRRGGRLVEREWMPSALSLAKRFDVPLIPLNIRARNSMLFYLFDLIHPSLRDITLFYETLNKKSQSFQVSIGRPIQPDDLPKDAKRALATIRQATLNLGHRDLELLHASKSLRSYGRALTQI